MSYRFSLEKYSGPSSRYTCPNCHQAKEFTRYIDTETGRHLNDAVGICSRRAKCGYHYPPRDFFAANPGHGVERSPRIGSRKVVDEPEPKAFDCIDRSVLIKTMARYEENNFVQFLFSRFPACQVEAAIRQYFGGTWDDFQTVFWQLDELYKIRSGKLIRYDSKTGKRDHDSTNWVHARMKRTGDLPTDFNLKQCFFGQHLLRRSSEQAVGVVESEKTAIITSICVPQYIWLATGGIGNLSKERLMCIRTRRIILFPDEDGFDNWTNKRKDLKSAGFNISVSSLIETRRSSSAKEMGLDLADLLIAAKR